MTPSTHARIPLHADGLRALIQALQGKPPTDTPTRSPQRTPAPDEEIARGREIYEAFERNTTGELWGARWNFERAIRRYHRPPTPKEHTMPHTPDRIPEDKRDQWQAQITRWYAGERLIPAAETAAQPRTEADGAHIRR